VAFGFYAALFDWDLLTEFDMGPMGMYLIFGRNDRQVGGMFDQSKGGKQGAAYWLGYVSVTDLERTVERAKTARGSVLVGPMDVPGGDRIAQLMDPYGAFFALHKAAAPAAATDTASGGAGKPAKRAARKKAGPRRAETERKRAAKKRRAKQVKPKARKKTKTKPAVKKKPARKPTVKRKSKRKKKAAKKSRTRGR
jgi:predicted enzyme related to lactoylglutathione lyase